MAGRHGVARPAERIPSCHPHEDAPALQFPHRLTIGQGWRLPHRFQHPVGIRYSGYRGGNTSRSGRRAAIGGPQPCQGLGGQGLACLCALPWARDIPCMSLLTPSLSVGSWWPVARLMAAKAARWTRMVDTESRRSSARWER